MQVMSRSHSSLTDAAPRAISQLLLLDLLAATGVLGLVLYTLVDFVPALLDKTYLSEALLMARSGQIELHERLTTQGALPASSPGTWQTVDASPVPAFAKTKLALSQRIDGDTLILQGRLPGHATHFALAFAPSELREEPAGSMQWLCGQSRPQAGWSGPPLGPGSSLTSFQLPFVCRHHAP